MTLLKTGILNAVSVVIKMLALLGLNKLLAIYVGPAGFAAIGQFQNVIQVVTSISGGAVNNGVVKYTAENADDPHYQIQLWKTAGSITFLGSILVSIFIVLFSRSLSARLLGSLEYETVFYWLAGGLVFFVGNALLLAILNGKKEIGYYVTANIIGSFLSICVSGGLVVFYALYGALVALAIYQSVAFFTTLFLCGRTSWFKIRYLFWGWNPEIAKNLSKYVLMALTSAVCVPVSQMLIRDHIGKKIGWAEAGQWEGMWRLSAAGLMIVTTTLTLYYLPRLSELRAKRDIKKEIKNTYKIILPAVIFFSLIIYMLRDFIIILLFTSEFLPMRELFAGQLIGDVLRVGSLVIAYLMLSRAMLKLYLFSEVFFAVNFVLLSMVLVDEVGLQGVVFAHAINYFLYWIFMAWAIFYSVFKKNDV